MPHEHTLDRPIGFKAKVPVRWICPERLQEREGNGLDLKECNMDTDALLNHREKFFHGAVAGSLPKIGLRMLPRISPACTFQFSPTLRHIPHVSSDGWQSPSVNYTLLPHPALHLQPAGGFGKNLERRPSSDCELRRDPNPRHPAMFVKRPGLGLVAPASSQRYTFTSTVGFFRISTFVSIPRTAHRVACRRG